MDGVSSHDATGGVKAARDDVDEVEMDPVEKAFVGLMISCYCIDPISVLIHELAHAAAAIRAGRRPVVNVGPTERAGALHWRLRRLDFRFHPYVADPKNLPRGFCIFDDRGLTARQLRMITLAGPLASVAFGAALAVPLWLIDDRGSLAYFTLAISSLIVAVELIHELLRGRSGRDGRPLGDFETLRSLDGSAAETRRLPPEGLNATSRPPPAPPHGPGRG
jgi:hypothetical protein